jgi:uncharacterized protein (TIGR03067 family)
MAVLCLSLIFAAASGNQNESVDGTWSPAAAELGGKMFPEEMRKAMKLEVKDDKYTVTVGKAVDKGTLKRNPATKPKEMDIVGTDGPNKGKTILAIYEREGDTLKICYDLGGKGRPTSFNTEGDPLLFLVTYKREKP